MNGPEKIFSEFDIDCILVTGAENMRYLSGFAGGTGCLLISENKKYLLTDSRYTLMAKNQADGFTVVQADGTYPPLISDICAKEKISAIGFENKHISYDLFDGIQSTLAGVEYRPLDFSLDELRTVKTEEEISYVQAAEKAGDIAFEKILNDIKPGVTEIEIAAKIEYYLKTSGGEAAAFDTIVASGKNSAMPHAVPAHKKLEAGDIITMDFGCKVNGYCSDMTRTVVLGHADAEQKRMYKTVLEAQMRAIDAAHAGMTGGELDGIAREYIDRAGYEGKFGHGLGHGLGLAVHERPVVSRRGETELPENCIVTIEPGIYVDGICGVRIEDAVVLKKDDCINLTGAEKQLIEL